MNSEIFVHKSNNLPVNISEMLRYSGCQGTDDDILLSLANGVISEIDKEDCVKFNVCYRILPVKFLEDNEIDFSYIKVRSKDLTKCIGGCDNAVFMAATIGQGIDRIIRKYNSIDSARALFMQGLGAERIETMLDAFCDNFTEIVKQDTGMIIGGVTPRFSPGYGDLELAIQPDFLGIIDARRKLGITINDSLLMAPSKSVTAIMGIKLA